MRISLSWGTWIKIGIICLPCVWATGCKSTTPGMSWFSWAKPSPPTAALSSNVPTKPSINSLPSPNSALSGGPTAGAGNAAGAGYQQPGAPGANNGYYTGPYGMSGQAPAAQPAAAGGNLAGGSYGGSGMSAAPAYGGYQSPYGAPAGQQPGGGGYRTADSRNAAGAAANANAGSYYGAPASGANAWNNEQWGRSGSQPAGYAETLAPRGFEAPAAPANNASPTTSVPSTSPSTGGYRPGSTGRTAGSLTPSLSAGPAGASSTVYPAAAGYPAASNPAGLYPETGAASGTPSNSTGFAGGYSYPSTTQLR